MNVVPTEQNATISVDRDLVTLVNVFKVKPENQQQLVDMLIEATEDAMAKLPGFISANIHKSLDGEWVTNYAQWRSVEDFRAIFQNPKAREHMPKIGKIAESSPVLYEVCYTKHS